MKKLVPILLALSMVLGFAQAQSRAETAIVAVSIDASSMNPWLSTNITDKNVVSHLYDTLLKRDQDMSIQPNVATSWQALDDTTWEFELRDDVVFTNGQPLTAADVAYTVEHFRDPELNAPSIAQFNPIEAVEAVDATTVRFTTAEPFPALPAVLTEFWIVPEGYTRDVGGQTLGQEPVGSGPYLLEEWIRDDHILLRANADWWAGEPAIPYVEFRIVPDQNTRIAQMQTGEADLVASVPAEAAAVLERASGVDVLQAPNPRAYFLGFNQRVDTPLQNQQVRQAMNLAIDVEGIIEFVFDGRGSPLATLVTPQQFGYDPSVEPYGYDPDRARELLAEAGYPDGFSIQMEAPQSRYPKDAEVAQAVAAQLGEIGVAVDLDIQEWGTYVGQFRAEDGPPIYFLGWSIPTFDPDSILTPLLTEGATYGRFAEPELEALIDEARSTVGDEARAELYSQVQQRMKELAPMAFLYQLDELYAVQERLDWEPRADERIYLWNASLSE